MSHSDRCARCGEPRRNHTDPLLLCPAFTFVAPSPPETPAPRDPARVLREAARDVLAAYDFCRSKGSFSGFWTHIDDLAKALDAYPLDAYPLDAAPETPAPHDLADAQADAEGWADLAAKAAPETPAPEGDECERCGGTGRDYCPTCKGTGSRKVIGYPASPASAPRETPAHDGHPMDPGLFFPECPGCDAEIEEISRAHRAEVNPASAPSPVESPGEEGAQTPDPWPLDKVQKMLAESRAPAAAESTRSDLDDLITRYGEAVQQQAIHATTGDPALIRAVRDARNDLRSAFASAPREVEEDQKP